MLLACDVAISDGSDGFISWKKAAERSSFPDISPHSLTSASDNCHLAPSGATLLVGGRRFWKVNEENE